jgi:hypothetical protein
VGQHPGTVPGSQKIPCRKPVKFKWVNITGTVGQHARNEGSTSAEYSAEVSMHFSQGIGQCLFAV